MEVGPEMNGTDQNQQNRNNNNNGNPGNMFTPLLQIFILYGLNFSIKFIILQAELGPV